MEKALSLLPWLHTCLTAVLLRTEFTKQKRRRLGNICVDSHSALKRSTAPSTCTKSFFSEVVATYHLVTINERVWHGVFVQNRTPGSPRPLTTTRVYLMASVKSWDFCRRRPYVAVFLMYPTDGDCRTYLDASETKWAPFGVYWTVNPERLSFGLVCGRTDGVRCGDGRLLAKWGMGFLEVMLVTLRHLWLLF